MILGKFSLAQTQNWISWRSCEIWYS